MPELEQSPEPLIDQRFGDELLGQIVLVADFTQQIKETRDGDGFLEIERARDVLDSDLDKLARAVVKIEYALPGVSFDRLLPAEAGEVDSAENTDVPDEVASESADRQNYSINLSDYSAEELSGGRENVLELERALIKASGVAALDDVEGQDQLVGLIKDYSEQAQTQIDAVAEQKDKLEADLVEFHFDENRRPRDRTVEAETVERFVTEASFDDLVFASSTSSQVISSLSEKTETPNILLKFDINDDTEQRLAEYKSVVDEEIVRRLKAINAFAAGIPEFNLLPYSNGLLDESQPSQGFTLIEAHLMDNVGVDKEFKPEDLTMAAILQRISALDEFVMKGREYRVPNANYNAKLLDFRNSLYETFETAAGAAKYIEERAKMEIFTRLLPDFQIPEGYKARWNRLDTETRHSTRQAAELLQSSINNGQNGLATETGEPVTSSDFGLVEIPDEKGSTELAIAYIGERLKLYPDEGVTVTLGSINSDARGRITMRRPKGGSVVDINVLGGSDPRAIQSVMQTYPDRFNLDGSRSAISTPELGADGTADNVFVTRIGDSGIESVPASTEFDPNMHQLIPIIPLSKLARSYR